MNRVRFVGLDVHAKPIAVESQRRAEVRSLDSPRDTGGMRPVACSNVGRMASCAILAMRTVSRRCLGKSAQITYCRQCAVMVPFFYELRDHGHWGMLAFVFGFGTWLRQKDRVMLSCSRSYVLPDETAQFALPNAQVDRRLTTIPRGFSSTLQSSSRHAS